MINKAKIKLPLCWPTEARTVKSQPTRQTCSGTSKITECLLWGVFLSWSGTEEHPSARQAPLASLLCGSSSLWSASVCPLSYGDRSPPASTQKVPESVLKILNWLEDLWEDVWRQWLQVDGAGSDLPTQRQRVLLPEGWVHAKFCRIPKAGFFHAHSLTTQPSRNQTRGKGSDCCLLLWYWYYDIDKLVHYLQNVFVYCKCLRYLYRILLYYLNEMHSSKSVSLLG